MTLNTRPSLHRVDTTAVPTHHIGRTFHKPAPVRPRLSLWARFVMWIMADDPWETRRATNRTCCDGLCQQGRQCPAFAPGVIDGPHSKGSKK